MTKTLFMPIGSLFSRCRIGPLGSIVTPEPDPEPAQSLPGFHLWIAGLKGEGDSLSRGGPGSGLVFQVVEVEGIHPCFTFFSSAGRPYLSSAA